ncbi:unnamed protein product [Lactuca saligna]|uniref:DUF659 domain-containing protein n=1 Tax=Lactuca saligna TaxID=75948 RepID=A0AA35ZRL5_LACSI|nr:unnamed protein product [Lactuca saligna]
MFEWRYGMGMGRVEGYLEKTKHLVHISGGITRVKQHLTHTGGQVTGCPNVTVDIQKRVMASMKKKDRINIENKRNIQILRSSTVDLSDEVEDEEFDVQEVSVKRNVSKKKKFVGSSNDKISTWVYSVHLPFNVVRDKSFQDMIYSIEEYGRGMPAPSYHNIRVTLMKKCLEHTRKFVDSFCSHCEEYRCSIMSNFWTDGKGRCLINFLVSCPLGTIFLKSIDASEHVKNAQLIVEMINEVIKDVGDENIVQFITDNGSNFKAAGKILEEQHPKLFWTPCATHCVNLMIRDIGEKIPKIKTALTDARAIVVYIYNHGRILNLMSKLTKNKELHRQDLNLYIDSIGQFGSLAALRARTKVAPSTLAEAGGNRRTKKKAAARNGGDDEMWCGTKE